jgi:hypothetical protein
MLYRPTGWKIGAILVTWCVARILSLAFGLLSYILAPDIALVSVRCLTSELPAVNQLHTSANLCIKFSATQLTALTP